MSRTAADDREFAEHVARTLRTVAEATPVDPSRTPMLDPTRVTGPLPRHRPPPRRRVVAALAAAATVAAIATAVVTLRGSNDEARVDVGNEVDPATQELVAGWLPADLTTDEPLGAAPALGIALTGQALHLPGQDAEILVVEAVAAEGEQFSDQVRMQLMARIGATWGDGDQEGAATSTGATLVLGRGAATEQDVDAVVAAAVASDGVPLDPAEVPDGWAASPTSGPLDWLPGVAATRGRSYGTPDGSRAVEVAVLAGDLPDDEAVASLLPGSEATATPGRRGWLVDERGTGERLFLWQEAPGAIGAVTGRGLTDEELLRVADGAR